MSKYNGLFTFDVDNHRYVPVEQADGLISDKYNQEPKEEPLKPYWFINGLDGEPIKCDLKNCGKSNYIKWGECRKQIGNYFETKEEAELAGRKLKAWKRLKDKGFRFEGYSLEPEKYSIEFVFTGEEAWLTEVKPDLDLLFRR